MWDRLFHLFVRDVILELRAQQMDKRLKVNPYAIRVLSSYCYIYAGVRTGFSQAPSFMECYMEETYLNESQWDD